MPNVKWKAKAIVNPKSANGETEWKWKAIKVELEKAVGKVEAEFTSGPDIATLLTRRALQDGFDLIIAVGGDGTTGEVANGFFEQDQPVAADAALGIIPMGTGKDFVKTLGIPADFREAAARLATGKKRALDLGKYSCKTARGVDVSKFFLNIADFGVGGETVARVNGTTKMFGGTVSFFLGSALSLLSYKNKKVRISIDDGPAFERTINCVAIANGQYFGGGMHVAPLAKPDDGKFDIVIIDQMSALEAFKNFKTIYKGEHVNHDKVEYVHGKKVFAESDEQVMIDADGEQPGVLPATFELYPKAIKVVC
ncbi:MAG: diacylglycerol kinase family lipid kinase [Planctomycetes bacterium]|nr:diacylglycerol kinase family lipid kinase [Planctomycetota bacterium]